MGLVYSLIYDKSVDEKPKDENKVIDDINEFNIVLVKDESLDDCPKISDYEIIYNPIDLSTTLDKKLTDFLLTGPSTLDELVKFSLEKLNVEPLNISSEDQNISQSDLSTPVHNNSDQYEIPPNMLSSFEKLIQIPSHTTDYKKLQNKPNNSSYRKRNKKKF